MSQESREFIEVLWLWLLILALQDGAEIEMT